MYRLANRFGEIVASTELFNVGTASPTYADLRPEDVNAVVAPSQTIELYASSAKASLDDPLVPDADTETTPVAIGRIEYVAGGVQVGGHCSGNKDHEDQAHVGGPGQRGEIRQLAVVNGC